MAAGSFRDWEDTKMRLQSDKPVRMQFVSQGDGKVAWSIDGAPIHTFEPSDHDVTFTRGKFQNGSFKLVLETVASPVSKQVPVFGSVSIEGVMLPNPDFVPDDKSDAAQTPSAPPRIPAHETSLATLPVGSWQLIDPDEPDSIRYFEIGKDAAITLTTWTAATSKGKVVAGQWASARVVTGKCDVREGKLLVGDFSLPLPLPPLGRTSKLKRDDGPDLKLTRAPMPAAQANVLKLVQAQKTSKQISGPFTLQTLGPGPVAILAIIFYDNGIVVNKTSNNADGSDVLYKFFGWKADGKMLSITCGDKTYRFSLPLNRAPNVSDMTADGETAILRTGD